MSNTHPPILATWILKNLVPGDCKDAISGDLLEVFRSGRSARWYWRQVLAALANGYLREVLTHSPIVVFAVLWILPAQAWWSFVFWPAAHQTGFIFPWPYSAVFGMAIAVCQSLWAGLAVYAGLSFLLGGKLRLEGVARRFWLGPFLFALLSIAVKILSHPLGISNANLGTAKLIICCLSLVAAGWKIKPCPKPESTVTITR